MTKTRQDVDLLSQWRDPTALYRFPLLQTHNFRFRNRGRRVPTLHHRHYSLLIDTVTLSRYSLSQWLRKCIRVRIIFFNTYCLSLFYYVQSIHCFSKKDLQPLYLAMADFVLQRRWFPARFRPGLMRWLKIGPLLDPHLMHAVALLGFFSS